MKTIETPLKTYKSKIKGISEYKFRAEHYGFQKTLTTKLDKIKDTQINIDQGMINEIVLWKTNRYAVLSSAAENAINNPALRNPKLNKTLTAEVLNHLLGYGIQIPMASTILRFINPKVYQILDQRAYRFVFNKPFNSKINKENQIEKYLAYLNELKKVRQIHPRWKFEDLDRILYLLDKEHNSKHKIN